MLRNDGKLNEDWKKVIKKKISKEFKYPQKLRIVVYRSPGNNDNGQSGLKLKRLGTENLTSFLFITFFHPMTRSGHSKNVV